MNDKRGKNILIQHENLISDTLYDLYLSILHKMLL